MFSYLTHIVHYLTGKDIDEDNDKEKENYLAEQLLELELQAEKETSLISTPVKEVPKNAVCFQKTGVITYCGENYVLIDGMIYYDMSGCTLDINMNDKVIYLGYKDSNDTIVIVRILQNQGLFRGEGEEDEEQNFDVMEHILIGQVGYRENRLVFIADSDLKFSVDQVEGNFVPIKGDWLEMKCTVQQDEKNPSNISTNQVLNVISFHPIRIKVKNAVVTEWSGKEGTCDRHIYFNQSVLVNGSHPTLGSKVLVEAIESTQGQCTWRAIKILVTETVVKISQSDSSNDEQISLSSEKEKHIEMTYPLKFEKVDFQGTSEIVLNISNNSNEIYILNKWMLLGKKKDSQVTIKPFVNKPLRLNPNQSFRFNITCTPKFLGNSKEYLILLFQGFQLKRIIEINTVVSNDVIRESITNWPSVSYLKMVEQMKKIRNNENSLIPGQSLLKKSPFVMLKIGHFPIPDKVWAVVLGDSEEMIYSNEFQKTLSRIEDNFPCLLQDLNISNYIDKWHTLLYIEEIQCNLNMRVYDKSKVYLTHCDEYLSIEVPGLAEQRPSLIVGDRAIVKDTWNSDSQYEGFIHSISGNLVLIKFNSIFHDTYSGGDVSIEFHFSRTKFRRGHYAINLALSNLGPTILFPSTILVKPQHISDDSLKKLEWYNTNLNKCQKDAVINILKGECRPMPYIIYGPPGTGKTITVIETILQILSSIPESRILVATPSNSASNLITERLIKYKGQFKGSIVRLIAQYLAESDSLPDIIKPYCATLDIAIENPSNSKHFVKDNINRNCPKSLIGRHRVTIGTCYCLGALKHIGLPHGHFTHVIVDEAGQATEPEIMLPLTFTDKEHGQIILAGDPMQLGPIVVSNYSRGYGMDESFLCRLLERLPYLKDYEAYKDGFDDRLVTKLNDNYRSLKDVLRLPNEMFYDSTLVAKVDKSLLWTSKFINATSEFLDGTFCDGGVFVYGIKGVNLRAEDSPSWYNPQEAAMVALAACKLYKSNVTANEIGIITPYVAQTKYIRVTFDSMGLPQPKIGTVEDFQGQERPIILISTVRSNESMLEEDVKHSLGFINNPKRLNVALTRAQVSCILFCNPHLLSKHPLWDKVIADAVQNDRYKGCDLPYRYMENIPQ